MNFNNLISGKFSWKRLMSSVILIPFFVYLGLGIIAYFWADKLIFQPKPMWYGDGDWAFNLTTPNGQKISATSYKNETAEFTILFSHGNAENISDTDHFLRNLRDAGFNVLTYDYRGYGMSDGKPSEQNSYEEAETAYNYLVNDLKIPPAKIIIYGRSLGGAVSIDLASRKLSGGLIAESTFVSVFRVLTPYKIYPFDKFQNLGKIKQVKCPVLFIHGRKDQIIPFWHGEKLFAEANEPKFSFWIDEAGHNNIYQTGGKAYLQRIRDFADNLSPESQFILKK
jgi:abhydrolase domain-containing protein 17